MTVPLETRGTAHLVGSQEEHQVLVRKQKESGAIGLSQSLYWGLNRKGETGQGKQFRIGLFE